LHGIKIGEEKYVNHPLIEHRGFRARYEKKEI
jgi:hypothetical protein